MKKYLGTKLIKALPMNRLAYDSYRGWELPDDEDGSDEGYLVEYIDGGESNHPDHEGYISWSPVDVFLNAYKPANTWEERLKIEHDELAEKLKNLDDFLADDSMEKPYLYLSGQSKIMHIYLDILKARLESRL